MQIMIVDDERMSMYDIKDTVEAEAPEAKVTCFDNCTDAIEYVRNNRCDVAFLDIAMPGRNGLELAKDIKEISKNTNIVFVTGYSEYAVDAFSINVSGYILKPARKEDVRNALDNLRIPVRYDKKKLRIQCFGNFEAFYDEKPLNFKRSITKELLAYLVDRRGASANTDEICSVLFDERTNFTSQKHYLRNLIADLRSTLEDCGAKDVFVYKRNSFAIDPSKVECDYYKYIEGNTAAVNSYAGEYMNQYSWAEMTNGFLMYSKMPPDDQA